MGTNYYVRSNFCHDCQRFDEDHICKSLSSFEAKRRWDENGEVVIECGSWSEWRDYLRSPEVHEIRDEYGRTHEIEAFIASVESVAPENRGRQHAYWMRDYPQEVSDGPAPEKNWVCPDGFSFSAVEFS